MTAFRRLLRRRRRVLRTDDGVALVSVLGVMFVMTILVTTLLGTSSVVLRQSRQSVDWNAAVAAAEAGIEDYLFRINTDPYYWERAPTSIDAAGVATPNPRKDTANEAYDRFVAVPGAQNGARFTYSVEPAIRQTGMIVVTSTGLVDDVARTVRTTLRKRSFLDYVYFSDYETRDPAQYETWPSSDEDAENGDRDGAQPDVRGGQRLTGDWAVAEARRQCMHYKYDTSLENAARNRRTIWNQDRADGLTGGVLGPAPGTRQFRDAPGHSWDGRHADCHEPHWTADVFDGPYHTNDIPPIRQHGGSNGIFFPQRPATTAWKADGDPPRAPDRGFFDVQYEVNGRSTKATPSFPYADLPGPAYAPPLPLPPANTELLGAADSGGYVFRGPTRIVLRDNRLWVDSPASANRHGLNAQGRGLLALPGNGIAYVEGYSPTSAQCTNFVPPLAGDGTSAAPNYLDRMYPDPKVSGNYRVTGVNADITKYSCGAGDAFVEGRLQGRLTVGAQHDVWVTSHIGYQSVPTGGTQSGYGVVAATAPATGNVPAPPTSDRDLLGMVPNGSVKLFKPTACRYWRYGVCQHGHNIMFRVDRNGKLNTIQDLTVYASLLSTGQSMRLMNQMIGGGVGTLSIHGSIAQKFRGNLGSAGGNTVPRSGVSEAYGGNPGSAYAGVPSTCGSTNERGTQTLFNKPPDSCGTSGGFGKIFSYDKRLEYLSPPSFLQPVEVSWGQVQFEENTADAAHLARPRG